MEHLQSVWHQLFHRGFCGWHMVVSRHILLMLLPTTDTRSQYLQQTFFCVHTEIRQFQLSNPTRLP